MSAANTKSLVQSIAQPGGTSLPHQSQVYFSRCHAALRKISAISSWTQEQVQWVEKQINNHAKGCRKLARASATAKSLKLVKLQAHLLRGFAGRLCGELYELCFGKHAKKPLEPLTFDELESRLQSSPLVAGQLAGKSEVLSVPKGNGKWRSLVSPDHRTRAAQRTVANVVDVRCGQHSLDFNRSGKGRDSAVREVQRVMLQEGMRWFVLFDIENCFSSVKPTHLKWLSLPRQVVEEVIFHTGKSLLIRYSHKHKQLSVGPDKMASARRGLPQGAITSPKLASALLGREVSASSGETGTVTYVDDGVIGAHTQADAQEIAESLLMRFANLNGGPIGFKFVEVLDAYEGFAFLNYWLKLTDIEGAPYVRITPSHQAKMKFRKRLYRRLRQAGPSLTYDEAVSILEKYRANWVRSFHLWKPSAGEMESWVDESLCYLDDFTDWTAGLPGTKKLNSSV